MCTCRGKVLSIFSFYALVGKIMSLSKKVLLLPVSTTLGRSLMNIMKNRGPTRNPEEYQSKLPTRMKMHNQSISIDNNMTCSGIWQ